MKILVLFNALASNSTQSPKLEVARVHDLQSPRDLSPLPQHIVKRPLDQVELSLGHLPRRHFLRVPISLEVWDFVSAGHGDVPWEDVFRMLRSIDYQGPVSVEWEDAGMDRLQGAPEALTRLKAFDFDPPSASFDAAFNS